MNRNIAVGLDEGGVASAIEVFDWTTGVPGTLIVNLTAYERNLRQAQRLADRIIEFRDEHPGAPVHLIGHSGGGGLAVLALEALPAGRQIDMVILLAPALSPDYDLSTSLLRSRRGVVNFYSDRDRALLKAGTSVFGSIDRRLGPAAGAVGFKLPREITRDGRKLYDERLRQVRWSPRLKQFGVSGTHIGWTSRQFAREYLAELVRQNEAARPLPAERLDFRTPDSPDDVEFTDDE